MKLFSRSGRFSVSVATPSAASSRTVSNSVTIGTCLLPPALASWPTAAADAAIGRRIR
ncbi:MAG: hypothetical protein MZV49_09450 [Rhodopseudomonas palustris]|nr:hypothetical protein [Rhodopseudomonas palustris]